MRLIGEYVPFHIVKNILDIPFRGEDRPMAFFKMSISHITETANIW